MNFCTNCGKILNPEYKPKEPIGERTVKKVRSSIDRKYVIPILSAFGLFTIIFSLLQIFDLGLDETIVTLLIYSGFSTSIIALLLVPLFLQIKRFHRHIVTTFLLFSESVGFFSVYMFDLMERTILSRNILFIVSILIGLISLSSILYLKESNYQMVHRVIGSYIAWMSVYYVAGTVYITSMVFTLCIMVLLLGFMTISLFKPSLPVMGSFVIIEFLVFLNTTVINTSLLFYISLLHIIIMPIMLFLYDTRIKIDGLGSADVKMLILIYFIPLLSQMMAIGNNALLNPFPLILLVVFGISWTLYFMYARKKTEISSETKIFALLAILMLFFLQTIFSMNMVSSNLIVIYTGVIIITTILRGTVAEEYRVITRIGSLILASLLVYPIYNVLNYSMYLTLTIFLLTFLLSYTDEIRFKKSPGEKEFSLGVIIFAIFVSLHYFLKPTPIYIISVFFGVSLVISFISRRIGYRYWYQVFSISLAIVGLSSYYYHSDETILIISQLLIITLLGALLATLSKFDDKGNMLISWFILALPIVFGLDKVTNHWVINAFLAVMQLFALISIFLSLRKEVSITWFYLFSVFGLLGRIFQYGESSAVVDLSVWAVTVSVVYIGIGLLLNVFKILHIKRSDSRWYDNFLPLILWLLLGLVINYFAAEFSNEFIRNHLWMVIQSGIVLFMLLDLFVILKNSSQNALTSISFTGLLHVIFISTVDSQLKGILWILLIVILMSVMFRMTANTSSVSILLWLVATSSNLILLSLQNVYAIDVMLVSLFLIFSSEAFLNILFTMDMRGRKFLHVVLYILISMILLAFRLADKLPFEHVVITYYLITAILLVISRYHKDTYLISGIVFLLFSTLLMGYELHVLYLLIGCWVMALLVTFVNYRELLVSHTQKYLPTFNYLVVSQSTINLMSILISAWFMFNQLRYPADMLNQWLSLTMAVILVFSILFERIKSSNSITDSLVMSSFIILLGSSLLGFFTSATSNLILGSIAISVVIASLVLNENKLFRVGLSVSVISVIKLIIDLIYLSQTIDRAFSGLIVGVQAIFYAIVYSAYQNEKSEKVIESANSEENIVDKTAK